MSTFDRWIKNLSATPLATRRRFPTHALRSIEKAITTVESKHAGEIRFVIETALDLGDLWARRTPRQRAVELFGRLGVWDTERNNGVLIYLLMDEHDVEIVADRGISSRVAAEEWEEMTQELLAHGREADACRDWEEDVDRYPAAW